MDEMVVCGASLEGICTGDAPAPELETPIKDMFLEPHPPAGFKVLPRYISGEDGEEEDLLEDGTYDEMPAPIVVGDVRIPGALVCTACYVTLCMISPSGQGLRHELKSAIRQAWQTDPSDLPRIG